MTMSRMKRWRMRREVSLVLVKRSEFVGDLAVVKGSRKWARFGDGIITLSMPES